MFLVDDMGWMDCGAYGSEYYETPRIDELARRGTLFTDAYSPAPVCSPTRAGILTGKHPARLGITGPVGHLRARRESLPRYAEQAPPSSPVIAPTSLRFLDPAEHTLARALREAGYRTGHIGKWHLGASPRHWPERHGFDVAWHGEPDGGPPRPNGYFSPYSFRSGTITPGPEGEYITDRITDEALRFLESVRDRPFFLNVWHFAVHGPWDHKQDYTRELRAKVDPSGRQGNPIMASMLRSVDESLGRIVIRLDELGLAQRTIIAFSSDHGGNVRSNTPGNWRAMGRDPERKADWLRWAGERPPTSNAPLRAGKGTLYEGGVRVPLVIAWPGTIPAGGRCEEIVSLIDLYPTLLDLLALEAKEGVSFDGRSFAPALLGEPAAEDHRPVFTFMVHDSPLVRPGVAVREGRWKLIRWYDAPPGSSPHELYDLREDVGETADLAPANPALVERLGALIDRFIADTGALVPKPNPAYRPGGNGEHGRRG